MSWIAADFVFDGQRLLSDHAVRLVDERVAEVRPVGEINTAAGRVALLTPGFVDLQVNGGGGHLLNAAPTAEAMASIAAAHRRFGTAAIMPTVITDTPAVFEDAVQAALDVAGAPWFAGLHMEGPHISEGRRGAHAAGHIRPMDETTFEHVTRLRAADIPVMVTLAPEVVAPEQVERLAKLGAVVSLGHSDADAAQAQAAFKAGATAVTHLFNAMSPLQGRAPGMVGTALASDAYVGVICDGVHVADDMVGVSIRSRPVVDRMFAVSDAMPTVGGPSEFTLYGNKVRLDGARLINEDGTLAGAHTTMAASFRRLVHHVRVPMEEALRMVVTVPADVVGRDDLGVLEQRASDDVMVFDDALALIGPLSERSMT